MVIMKNEKIIIRIKYNITTMHFARECKITVKSITRRL